MSGSENKMIRRRLANAYLSSVVSISLVLLLTGVAALLLINAGRISAYFRENVKISVLLTPETETKQAESYLSSVKTLPFVKDAQLISREQGEEELKDMLGEDFLSVFESSPVPISVDVTPVAAYVEKDSLDVVVSALSGYDCVDEVESRGALVEMLNENLARISLVFGVFICLLLFISFVLINNMVRLSVFARRFTIHTMKLVGATRSFIRAPFLRNALIQGLVSAGIASVALWGILYAARRSFGEMFNIFGTDTLLMSIGVIFLCGVLICVVSTCFVVGKLISANKDDLYY